MTNEINISVIIVNYFLSDLVFKCLLSIRDEFVDIPYEIIIVDNSVDDNERQKLTNYILQIGADNIDVIYNSKNMGFGTANNLGAKKASGNYLFFLNPDTTVKKIDIDVLKYFDEGVIIVGCKIIDEKGIEEISVGKYPNLFFDILDILILRTLVNRIYMSYLRNKNTIFVDWVTGAALLIKKCKFFEIRGFDEDYFLYSEDIDLCKRASKHGKIVYTSNIIINHKQSSGSKKNYYNFTKNVYNSKILYTKKHSKFYEISNLFLKSEILVQLCLWKVVNLFRTTDKSNGKQKAFTELLKNFN